MTLKQGQGHQNWYDLIDPKQGYNHAKFAEHTFNIITSSKILSNQEACQLSPVSMYRSFFKKRKKKWIIHHLPDVLNNLIKVQTQSDRNIQFSVKAV